MIRALIEELKPLAMQPGEFLTKLNSDLFGLLKHSGTPLLTTAFYLVADGQTGRMLYANAGHPKPLHLRRGIGKVVTLANASGKGQPALGLIEKAAYQMSTTQLSAGDLVLLYTDGLVEAQNQKEEFYDQELLLAAVQKRLQMPTGKLFDEILDELHEFSAGPQFADDVCMVGMELARNA